VLVGVDTRLLRTFRAVVEHGSFTAAANALGYTQSAVSQHDAALESSLGVELFRRRPFGLTPAAARLAEHAGNILLRLDVATSELRTVDRNRLIQVIATPLAAAHPRVAKLMMVAGAARQGSELSIGSVDDVVAAVARGESDAGVIDGIVGRADPLAVSDPGLLTSMLVHIDSLVAVLPAGHPLAGRAALDWSAVADAQWIDAPAIAPTRGPGATQLLRQRTGPTRYDGHDASTIASLVAAGHGLALVPGWWTHGRVDVVGIALRDPPLVHRIELVVLRPRAGEWSEQLAASHA
jgi:DNA-binding transcriptional LysR family regulator